MLTGKAFWCRKKQIVSINCVPIQNNYYIKWISLIYHRYWTNSSGSRSFPVSKYSTEKTGGATRCEKRQIHVTIHRYIPYIHTILNRIDINNIQISFQGRKCIQKSSKKWQIEIMSWMERNVFFRNIPQFGLKGVPKLKTFHCDLKLCAKKSSNKNKWAQVDHKDWWN